MPDHLRVTKSSGHPRPWLDSVIAVGDFFLLVTVSRFGFQAFSQFPSYLVGTLLQPFLPHPFPPPSLQTLGPQGVAPDLCSRLDLAPLTLSCRPAISECLIGSTCLLFFCLVSLCRQRLTWNPQRKCSSCLCVRGGLYLVSLDGAVFHVEIPNFDGQIVSGHDIPPTVAELHIRNRRDNFREKRPVAWIFRLFKNCRTKAKQNKLSPPLSTDTNVFGPTRKPTV